VVAEEPYRQLLADEVDDDNVTAVQPRKRLLNFKIPLLHKGAQRRGQGVSFITRRRGTAPQSPTIVQPRGTIIYGYLLLYILKPHLVATSIILYSIVSIPHWIDAITNALSSCSVPTYSFLLLIDSACTVHT